VPSTNSLPLGMVGTDFHRPTQGRCRQRLDPVSYEPDVAVLTAVRAV
jgi:hypothetical protein